MRRFPGTIAAVIGGLAFAAAGDPPRPPGDVAPPPPDVPRIVSAPASFSVLPEMWGLERLDEDTLLRDLDASFILYLDERARITITAPAGTIHFADGKPVASGDEATLAASPSTCALEYETVGTATELHLAAGAYRLAKPPVVTESGSGVIRIEFEFAAGEPGARTKLRRLVCRSRAGDRVAPIVAALPGFAKLTRKRHVAFVDPPRDERLVFDREVQPPGDADAPRRTVVVFGAGFDQRTALGRGREALELPPAKPGVLTLLRQLGSGKKRRIDHSEYFKPRDDFLLELDRSTGVHFRDPYYWP